MKKDWKFTTKAVHIGSEIDETTGAVIPPILEQLFLQFIKRALSLKNLPVNIKAMNTLAVITLLAPV